MQRKKSDSLIIIDTDKGPVLMRKKNPDKLTIVDTENGPVLTRLDEQPIATTCSTAAVQQHLIIRNDSKDEKNVAQSSKSGDKEDLENEFKKLLKNELQDSYTELDNHYQDLIPKMLNKSEDQLHSILEFASDLINLKRSESIPVIRAIKDFFKKHESIEFYGIYREALEGLLQQIDNDAPKILDGNKAPTASFRC